MKKCLMILTAMLFIFSHISCSEDDLTYFQSNDPEPEFSLFDLLDDFPALKSAFDPIDQRRFNNLLGAPINNNLKEAKDILSLVDDLLVDADKPVTGSISSVRNILSSVINQDKRDIDPVRRYSEIPEDSTQGLYELFDKISETNLDISGNIISIARKIIGYIKDSYCDDELEDVMTDLVNFIRENEAYLWRDNENNLCDDLGKLLFQANNNIYLDKNQKLISDRSEITKAGETIIDTGVGNAARGVDALLSGINALLSDDVLRENLFTVLREGGDIFTAEVQGKKLNVILKEFIHNIQKYLTPGGEEYEKWEEYIWPDFNPYSGYGVFNGEKSDNRERIYTDANIQKTLYDLLPGIQTLLLRSDRPGSQLYDRYGEKTYFLEIFARRLHITRTTPDNLTCTFSHIEEALYDHMRFDYAAKDRLAASYDPENYDPREEPTPMSNLEAMVSLFFGSAVNLGWEDRGMNTGELVNHPSTNHGNVEQTGVITLNNLFTGLGFNFLLGINPYDIMFTDSVKDHIFRSAFYFDEGERTEYKFNFDQNFPFTGLFGGPIVSDSGFPDGGRNPYDENGEPVLNAYRCYNGSGIANTDFPGWLFGFIVRNLMLGEGPYYTKQDMKQEGNVYTYFRPNGKIYVRVTKPDPDDASTWDYIYPADDPADTPSPAIFYSYADLITDGGALLHNSAVIKFNIDGITRDVTFNNTDPWHQDDVVSAINNAFADDFENGPVCPAGKGIQIKGRNVNPLEGIIEISDVSGSGIAMLIKDDYNGQTPIRERAGRENRYRERWNSDYYLVEYTPFGSLKNPIYVSPADMSGDATGPGSILAQELIPEHSADRECITWEEAIGRNFQWCYSEMMFSLPINLYASIQPDVIKDVLRELVLQGAGIPPDLEPAVNSFLNLLPKEIMAIPITMAIEGNGVAALLNLKFPHGSADNPVMGRWIKDGGFGKSGIPGDFRFSLLLPDKLLSDELMNLLTKPMLGIFPSVEDLLGIPIDDLINDVIDCILYGGNIMGILPVEPLIQHNMPLAPTLMCNAQAIGHIVFPRSVRQPIYSKEKNNSVYSNKYDLSLGSRQGELMRDDEGVMHPEWGLPHDDNHPDWACRNGVGLIYIILLEGWREYVGTDIDLYDPKYPTSAITHNSLSLHMDDLIGPIAAPPLYYYEKDTSDNRYPHNTWKPQITGGRLRDDHPLGEKYVDDDLYSNYFLTPTTQIGSSGVNKTTGMPLEPDSEITFGGWAIKNYYRAGDIRTILNIMVDSDPFAKEPKRLDGLLPLLTAYDADKYYTMDHSKNANSRLISGIFRILHNLGDPKYDDSNGPDGVDDNDMSTWGLRRKICYGVEQFITTLKTPKGYLTEQKEANYKRIMRPEWMFSEDENGNPYPTRPEDIMFEVAEFPAPPEVPDWENFDRLFKALGELLSDRGETGGKYNIMEDVISIIDKLFTRVHVSDDNTRSLRHSLGALFTKYNSGDSQWEYPGDAFHILEVELPRILELFQGRYGNLLILADALLKPIAGNEGFLEYVMKNLKSEYPTKDVVEQLHDFLGIDLITRPDSALWTDLAELLVSFVEMIEVDEQPGWLEEDTFHSNRVSDDADPYQALGELLSW